MTDLTLFAAGGGVIAGALLTWLIQRPRIAAAEETLRLKEEELRPLLGIREKVEVLSQILDGAKRDIEQLRIANQNLSSDLRDRESTIAGLNTRFESEQKHWAEKLALLEQNREQLKGEFQLLANRIFDEKSRLFSDQNRQHLDALLTPFKDQIKDFGTKVTEAYNKEGRERFALKEQIERLQQLNQRIGEDAENLTRALKGDTRTQGAWGEVILERILELSGLTKGREYETQESIRNADGALMRPDVIVHLPEGKDIVIDSKVSLTAYERSFREDLSGEGRDQAIREHLQSINAHLKELDAKNYESLPGLRSLDFVLMFIPVEGAFLLAMEQDPDLFRKAFERNIMIVSPSTLLVTLRTIQNIWRYEYQSRNAQEIASKAGALYDKFVGFVEDLEGIGRHLDRTRQSYDAAWNKLSSGKGNLISRAEAMKQLGVQSKKQLGDDRFREE